MIRTNKEYWYAHNAFRTRYDHQQCVDLFSHAVASIDDAVRLCEKLRELKFEQQMTAMEQELTSSHGSPEDRKLKFVNSIVSLIRWFPVITETGQAQDSSNSIATSLFGASWDMKKVHIAVRAYVPTLDEYAKKTLGDFSPKVENFHELYDMTLEEKKVGGPRYHALVWAFASHNIVLYQAIAIAVLMGHRDFSDSIALLTRYNARTIQKMQRSIEKESRFREESQQIAEQLKNSLRLKSEELTAFQKVCDKKEEQIIRLNEQLEKISAGITPSKELSGRVEELELELELSRDELRISRHGEQSWKALAEEEERDVERLRSTIKELWDVVHCEEQPGEELPSRRERYESRFQQIGLDYTIVDAIITAGLKCGKFVGESYIPVRHVKTNVFCRLKAPEQVGFVNSTLQELVRNNVLCTKKNDTALSINPHTKEITIPALREYVVECLDDARKRRTGRPVQNGDD